MSVETDTVVSTKSWSLGRILALPLTMIARPHAWVYGKVGLFGGIWVGLAEILLILVVLNLTTRGPGIDFLNYSDGIRVGQVVNYGDNGRIYTLFAYRYGEGHMMLGKDSARTTAGPITLENGDHIDNPWIYNFTSGSKSDYKATSGKTVVVAYRQSGIHFFRESPYVGLSVVPVTDRPVESCGNETGGARRDANEIGRIVKASSTGWIWPFVADEIIIQGGDGGNRFTAMSVTDSTIFQCAKQWAATGRKVSIHYEKQLLRWQFWEQRNTRVVTAITAAE